MILHQNQNALFSNLWDSVQDLSDQENTFYVTCDMSHNFILFAYYELQICFCNKKSINKKANIFFNF